MYEEILDRLAKSKFRAAFKLSKKDQAYFEQKGVEVIGKHAQDFIAARLAPAIIENDGKQTPMRNHPVFNAQHATACCCRQCFEKWHGIAAGKELTAEQQQFAVGLIMAWLKKQIS